MERSCDVCGKSFDSKIAYLMHQQPKNGILGRGQWYCCGCNKIFSTSYKKRVCRPASNPSNLPIGRTTQIFEQNALEERLDPESAENKARDKINTTRRVANKRNALEIANWKNWTPLYPSTIHTRTNARHYLTLL